MMQLIPRQNGIERVGNSLRLRVSIYRGRSSDVLNSPLPLAPGLQLDASPICVFVFFKDDRAARAVGWGRNQLRWGECTMTC